MIFSGTPTTSHPQNFASTIASRARSIMYDLVKWLGRPVGHNILRSGWVGWWKGQRRNQMTGTPTIPTDYTKWLLAIMRLED